MKRKSILFLLLMVGICNALVAQSLTTQKEYYDYWNLYLKNQWTELRDGTWHGTFKHYTRDGKLEESRVYDHGTITSCTHYFQDGTKSLTGKVIGPFVEEGYTYHDWPVVSHYFTNFTCYGNKGEIVKSYTLQEVSDKSHCDITHPKNYVVKSFSEDDLTYSYSSNGIVDLNINGDDKIRLKYDPKNKKLTILSASMTLVYSRYENDQPKVNMVAKVNFNGSTLTIQPVKGKNSGVYYKGKLYAIDKTITCKIPSKTGNYDLKDFFYWYRSPRLHDPVGGTRYITLDRFAELFCETEMVSNLPILDILEIPESFVKQLKCVGVVALFPNYSKPTIMELSSTQGDTTIWKSTVYDDHKLTLTLCNDEVLSISRKVDRDYGNEYKSTIAKGILEDDLLKVELIEGKRVDYDRDYVITEEGKFEDHKLVEGRLTKKYYGEKDVYVYEGKFESIFANSHPSLKEGKVTYGNTIEEGKFDSHSRLEKGKRTTGNRIEEGYFSGEDGDLISGVIQVFESGEDNEIHTWWHKDFSQDILTKIVVTYTDGSIYSFSGDFIPNRQELEKGEIEITLADGRDLEIFKFFSSNIPLNLKSFKCSVPSNTVRMEKTNGDVFEGEIPDEFLYSIIGKFIESSSSVEVIKGKYTTAKGYMLEGTFKKRDILYKGLDPSLLISGSADFITEFGRYTGGYAKGKAEGDGKIIIDDLGELIGTFTGDKISKKAICTVDFKLPTGDTFKGQMLGGKAHGYCELRFANGDYYIGEFANGKFSGTGDVRYTHSKGVYEGKVKDFVCQYDTPQDKKALKKIKAPKMPKIALPSKVGEMYVTIE